MFLLAMPRNNNNKKNPPALRGNPAAGASSRDGDARSDVPTGKERQLLPAPRLGRDAFGGEVEGCSVEPPHLSPAFPHVPVGRCHPTCFLSLLKRNGSSHLRMPIRVAHGFAGLPIHPSICPSIHPSKPGCLGRSSRPPRATSSHFPQRGAATLTCCPGSWPENENKSSLLVFFIPTRFLLNTGGEPCSDFGSSCDHLPTYKWLKDVLKTFCVSFWRRVSKSPRTWILPPPFFFLFFFLFFFFFFGISPCLLLSTSSMLRTNLTELDSSQARRSPVAATLMDIARVEDKVKEKQTGMVSPRTWKTVIPYEIPHVRGLEQPVGLEQGARDAMSSPSWRRDGAAPLSASDPEGC
ncbi:uncharacterized protein LOC134150902 isoform X1 [Rhea pennata]|uniref:uncharacterized protein LOC134150902 isoform X1 n=1 Tax=Rhea pennata TaxID=8795 RepID=UPI002E26ABA2